MEKTTEIAKEEKREVCRIALDDGGWFDANAAQRYGENTYWDGHNNVSLATKSQWNHEALYLTAKGQWILRESSQWQGSVPSAHRISEEEAARWFAKNELEPPEELLEATKALEA